MSTVNQALLDALIRHQVLLMRVSEDIRLRVQALLDATEQDISDKIRSRLLEAAGLAPTMRERRVRELLRVIKNIRLKAWEEVDRLWVTEAIELAKTEPTIMRTILATLTPVELGLLLPPVPTLTALVSASPFEGRVLREWAKSIASEDLRRIEAQVRMGVVMGESSADIARRVVGTVRMRGQDGVTQVTRRNAEAITRTMVNHFATEARKEFLLANADLVEEELFVATLDARTTPLCRSLDGNRYPLGQGPMPPLHFNCRSLRVPMLLGDALGDRPFRAHTTEMLLREYSAEAGIKTPGSRGALPMGHKGKFDTFARRRIRELTGRVPATTTYQEWLSAQSAAFQDDVLGKARGALFRRGGLTLSQFVNRRGGQVPLKELAQRHRQAFIDAGLTP